MGGFLGQVLRGRARIPRWMRCGAARGVVAWIVGRWWVWLRDRRCRRLPTPLVTQGAALRALCRDRSERRRRGSRPSRLRRRSQIRLTESAGLTTSRVAVEGARCREDLVRGRDVRCDRYAAEGADRRRLVSRWIHRRCGRDLRRLVCERAVSGHCGSRRAAGGSGDADLRWRGAVLRGASNDRRA